ncbi:MAG: sporulation transcription factor Spo0A [Candidatus Limiplasma sp.]|nr:sporulation transcription factor Spo0A [Candidatus Limiplasma sp.]
MHDVRLLVVDNHAELRRVMVEFLQKQEGIASVREAENGAEALNILANEPVDVMVTDLIMPLMDGYTLLEEMRKLPLDPTPKTIAVTALGRDDFVMRAIERGVMYYMVKPFDMKHLLRHIHEVMGISSQEAQPLLRPSLTARHTQSLDERLSSLFLTIGIPAHIKGYSFLREAVKMVIEQPDIINRITKELYPGIGKRFDTTASKVERAIRHAIEVAWSRGRIETLNRAFGCKVCTKEDKPTNGEFIAMIADKLSMERTA